MTGPSSSPRGEHTPRPGVTWETAVHREEAVVPDGAPDPRPNRATRRALARSGAAPATPTPAQLDVLLARAARRRLTDAEADRLRAGVAAAVEEQAALRDLLRVEHDRANAAIRREETGEEAALCAERARDAAVRQARTWAARARAAEARAAELDDQWAQARSADAAAGWEIRAADAEAALARVRAAAAGLPPEPGRRIEAALEPPLPPGAEAADGPLVWGEPGGEETASARACTCAVAGDAFAPAGHYADCPRADEPTPAEVAAEDRAYWTTRYDTPGDD